MKILLAIDGSEYSEAAVDEVARRPWPTPCEVRVVTAVALRVPIAPDPLVLYVGYREEMLEAQRARARALLEKTVERLRAGEQSGQLVLSTEVLEGSPKQAIVEEAERWAADLIVVGSHGYGRIERFLLGSVSQAVAAHAPCSVLIVRRR